MTVHRRTIIGQRVAAAWPFLWALLTVSIAWLLWERVSWPVYYRVVDAVWWINGTVAVAGAVTVSTVTARRDERIVSALGFAVWAVLVYGLGSCICDLLMPARR